MPGKSETELPPQSAGTTTYCLKTRHLEVGVTEGDDEGVSLPATVVPFEPDEDGPGEDDPSPGEGDPLPGEGVGESLAVGEVTGVGDGLVPGPGAGVGRGLGSGVGLGPRPTLNTAGALVALTV